VGLILDTSLIIAAERQGHTVREILEQVQAAFGETEIGLSVVTIAELTHGAYRAPDQTKRQRRIAFVERLCSDVPVYPFTIEIARLVGRIEGESASRGFGIPFADLLIGATALHLGCSVATLNLRHFRLIPDLQIQQLS
jgi:tRNA(fMet)-specific endonuclease VapC